MKKIIALIMVALMVVTMTACSKTEKTDKADNADNSQKGENVTESATVGETLLADFKADTNGSAQEIADRLIKNEIIEFMGGAMPVEEGLLTGFDNTEIRGFKEGVMFAPMMSSIAFVGYVFELADGTDVDEFKSTLKDSANLRWNICVEAEELIVENDGNKVFFLMCPKSFEQQGGADMPTPDMPAMDDTLPAEDGITLE